MRLVARLLAGEEITPGHARLSPVVLAQLARAGIIDTTVSGSWEDATPVTLTDLARYGLVS